MRRKDRRGTVKRVFSAFSAYLRVLCVNPGSNAQDAAERREDLQIKTPPA